MLSDATHFERRSAKRTRLAGRVWWIGQDGGAFREGWMFDTSRSGIAFLTQSGHTPGITEKVSICKSDPHQGLVDCETLRVGASNHKGRPSISSVARGSHRRADVALAGMMAGGFLATHRSRGAQPHTLRRLLRRRTGSRMIPFGAFSWACSASVRCIWAGVGRRCKRLSSSCNIVDRAIDLLDLARPRSDRCRPRRRSSLHRRDALRWRYTKSSARSSISRNIDSAVFRRARSSSK